MRYDPYSISLEPGRFAASATLEAGRGFCVAKAILYAAGLRALGAGTILDRTAHGGPRRG